MIAHSGRRLANLVNDILDYSQLQRDAAQPGGASRIRLQRSRVQLHSIVALILTMSEVTIGKKNVALVNAVPADLPLLWVDVNRLQQILYNLVGNAIKFTPAGEVRITAQLEAGETDFVAIWVADTGIGIPMAHQQRIFESFEQADGSMARQYGGSGLGLTVAKQLIERHGGNISVKSRVGGGSTFRFTMPIYDASREPEHEPTPLFELGAGFGAIPRSLARPIAPPSTTTSFVGPATTPAADTGDVSSNPSNLLAVSEAATLAEANHRRFKF
ncbi:MAG: hypothetical protein HC857_17145, partial [Synechococcales cyanobacterium RU_4_20]|nr:hypothetical protein [Synechococcales cyanobacterium RU_4_20]